MKVERVEREIALLSTDCMYKFSKSKSNMYMYEFYKKRMLPKCTGNVSLQVCVFLKYFTTCDS